MRLEIDEGLEKLLDQVKAKEPSIYGRGHAETVRFLANYYVHHKPLEELLASVRGSMNMFLSNLDLNLEKALERVLPKAAGRAIAALLMMDSHEVRSNDAQQPQRSGDPARPAPRDGC